MGERKPILRIPVPYMDLMKFRKYLVEQDEFFIAGSYSITWQRGHVKIMNTDRCIFWNDLDGQSVLMTPSEIARTEMMREFPTLSRVGWQKKNIELLDFGVPMLFMGEYRGDGVYVDLNRAYHTIYSMLPLNVLYPRGWPTKTLSLKPVAEKLKDNKSARNAVVGITRSRYITAYKGKKPVLLTAKNRFLSPPFWATIMDVLHELASLAVKLGAIYVNTDGYIFPDKTHPGEFTEYLEQMGYTFKVKRGDCHISGWGAYTIGDKTTTPYETKHNKTGNPYYPLSTIKKGKGNTILWLHNHNN